MRRCIPFVMALAVVQPAYADDWWVILKSYRDGQAPAQQTVDAAIAPCSARNGTSFQSRGFRKGHVAFVLGPYLNKGEAESSAQQMRPCIPGAHVLHTW